MWGKLADRIGATDINSTLEQIGNAVAPRDEDEDEDEEYYDEDDDGEEEYDDDYDDDDGSGGQLFNAIASPFRLPGMLTQVLDRTSSDNEEIVYNNKTADQVTQIVKEEGIIEIDTKDNNDDTNTNTNNTIAHAVFENDADDFDQISALPRDSGSGNGGGHKTMPISTEEDEISQLIKSNIIVEEQMETIVDGTKFIDEDNTDSFKTTIGESQDAYHEDKKTIKKKTKKGIHGVVRKGEEMHTSRSCEVTHSTEIDHRCDNNIDSINKTFGGTNNVNTGLTKDETNDEAERSTQQLNTTKFHTDSTIKNNHNTQPTPKTMISNEGNMSSLTPTNTHASTSTNTTAIDKEYKKSFSTERTTEKEDTTYERSALDHCEPDNQIKKHAVVDAVKNHKQDAVKPTIVDDEIRKQLLESEFNCKDLQLKLELAMQELNAVQAQSHREKQKVESEKDELIAQFHSKEARLLQATSEENQNQTLLLEQGFHFKIQSLEKLLSEEKKKCENEITEYKKLLRESYSDVDQTENQLKTTVSKLENDIARTQKREEHALQKAEDRMAQTMAVLDERDDEIKNLKKSIRNMQEGEEDAEEELEELHNENDSLRLVISNLEVESEKLKNKLIPLEAGSEECSGLRMQLTMLQEENTRQRTKNQSVIDSAMSSQTQTESERDTALSELRDTKQKLAAAVGDLEISRADYTRIMTANNNLQSALEAFQSERQAEMQMNDEQRQQVEEDVKSAHATAINALRQIHETELYELQKASDKAVKNVMHEMELLEGEMEKLKSENNQMRRSLNEAIHRLQTTQEDVIDRNVMKNILVDWCTLNDKKKRQQVLQVMANLLHFSDEERGKVHLTSMNLDSSVGAKMVGAFAAPLPPSKVDMDHLEGENAREKFVNFLMAETDDG